MTQRRSERIAQDLTQTPEYQDFPSFAENYFKILSRPEAAAEGNSERLGKMVPLKMNAVQRDLYERIEAARREGRPGRFVVLKARRMGVSTAVEAIITHRCVTQRNRKARIIAHDDDSTDTIFSMMKTFVERMPRRDKDDEMDKLDIRPCLRRNNDGRLWMTHADNEDMGLNSDIRVSPAMSTEAARSGEVHYLHGSEVGFWAQAKKLMGGTMPTLSDDPETLVVLESTADGVGGYFYDKFWVAYTGKDPRGRKVDTIWEGIFYAWHVMPNYALPLPPGRSWEEALAMFDDELLGMIKAYDLRPEQAYWAYRTWADKFDRDWDWFKQEFPGKPEDAFMFSGQRVFEVQDIEYMRQRHVLNPGYAGDIFDASERPEHARINYASDMEPVIRPVPGQRDQALWVWENEREGEEYVVAVDPSSGSTAGDFGAIVVMKAGTREQVAEWHGKVKPWVLAEKALLLCSKYNDALLTWEVEGLGHAVTDAVEHSDYWNLFERSTEGHAAERKWGWSTNRATKQRMVAAGVSALEARMPGVVRSSRLLKELETLKEFYKEKKTPDAVERGEEKHRRVMIGAPPGDNDDIAMAWFQALIVCDMEYGVAERPPAREVERDHRPSLGRLHWDDGAEVAGPVAWVMD